jgi:hypothetical protein
MRTHLEFRSQQLAGGANSINPGIHGGNLAEFLDRRFRALGYSGGVIEEDWGWMIPLAKQPFKLWVGCASYDEDGEWLVFIEPSKPFVRRWFGKTDTRPEVEKVATQLEAIVRDAGDATGLRWWTDEESGRR